MTHELFKRFVGSSETPEEQYGITHLLKRAQDKQFEREDRLKKIGARIGRLKL